MKTTNPAFGLWAGAFFSVCAVLAGCPPQPGANSGNDGGTNPNDAGTDGGNPIVYCTPGLDPDSASVTYHLTTLGIPNANGFDLDGINNAAKPGGLGATVAGCGQKDYAGGVDNALGMIATSLGGVIDLNTALGNTLAHTLPDGGTSGSIAVDVTVGHLASTGVATDPCVSVSATIQAIGGAPITVDGAGFLTDHVVTAVFDGALHFDVALSEQIPPSSCNGGTCMPGTLAIDVRGARARLALDATNTTMLPTSMIGGYLFFSDANPAYASLNPTGFAASLSTFATMVGLGPSFATQAVTAFEGAADLHAEPDGTLTRAGCSGSNVGATNRNTVSVALKIGGAAP